MLLTHSWSDVPGGVPARHSSLDNDYSPTNRCVYVGGSCTTLPEWDNFFRNL